MAISSLKLFTKSKLNLRKVFVEDLKTNVLGDQVGDVTSLRVDRSILDAKYDSVGIGHVLLRQVLDLRSRLRIHFTSDRLENESLNNFNLLYLSVFKLPVKSFDQLPIIMVD